MHKIDILQFLYRKKKIRMLNRKQNNSEVGKPQIRMNILGLCTGFKIADRRDIDLQNISQDFLLSFAHRGSSSLELFTPMNKRNVPSNLPD